MALPSNSSADDQWRTGELNVKEVLEAREIKALQERGFNVGLMDWWSKGPGENDGTSATPIRGRGWKFST
jgi:hypothetical protein